MRKQFKALIFFSLSIFISDITNAGEVKILSPSNNDEVGARVTVKGVSKNSGNGHVWVFVHAKQLQNQWWPQAKPVVDVEGNWQALAYIGQQQDVGYDFEIAVALFGKESESKILKYHDIGKKTGQWLPISLPKANSSIDIVTVKKTH